jgi:hypothetical protein
VRVIAPSPQVVAAANEAANDVHFVAVAGEGWIGWGAKRRRRRNLDLRAETNDKRSRVRPAVPKTTTV